MERRIKMKNVIITLIAVLFVAVFGVTLYLENENNNRLEADIAAAVDHSHDTSHAHSLEAHSHDTTHEHELELHSHDNAHEHDYDNQIRAMLELMFELENKVNAE